jgi:hypothetical protein
MTGIESARQHELRFVAGAVLRQEASDGVVTARVTAGGLEDRGDVFEDGPDPETFTHESSQVRALRRRVGFRHQQSQDTVGTDRADAERSAHRAVDPPRQPEHETAPPEQLHDLMPDPHGNPVHFSARIQREPSGSYR